MLSQSVTALNKYMIHREQTLRLTAFKVSVKGAPITVTIGQSLLKNRVISDRLNLPNGRANQMIHSV